MGAPIWNIPKETNLGKIVASTAFSLQLTAYDPDDGVISYKLIGGIMPPGLTVNSSGLIFGSPYNKDIVNNVEVVYEGDREYEFVIRVTNNLNIVTDRTFIVTVIVNDYPTILTPAGSLGAYVDGTHINLTLQAASLSPITWSIFSGSLPPGLTMDTHGQIIGYILPSINGLPISAAGFDGRNFDMIPFDQDVIGQSQTFSFTVQVSNGKFSSYRMYSFFVLAHNVLTSDTLLLTSDNSFILSSVETLRSPVITTPEGSLGTIMDENYFAFQFEAIDFDDNQVNFSTPSTLPANLTLDATTGWLYGYIPSIGPSNTTYSFDIQAYKLIDSSYISDPYTFTLTVVGHLSGAIHWITPSDLGTVDSGSISTLSIEAIADTGVPLFYEFLSSSTNMFPQGLELLSSGLITGKVSARSFSIDHETTTFDNNTTTFEKEFIFTILAYNASRTITSTRTFTLHINSDTDKPFENLFIRAYPSDDQKYIVDNILNNPAIPNSFLYRPNDSYFGRASDLSILMADGLNPSEGYKYIQAMQKNHYRKKIAFGNIRSAQAKDVDGNIKYEVVYIEPIDDQANYKNESTVPHINFMSKLHSKFRKPLTVDEPFPNATLTMFTADQVNDFHVYPNSFHNMRKSVIDHIGQLKSALPEWMTSVQPDQTILGWVPAIVLFYTKPGYSNRVMFELESIMAEYDIKLVSFDVDRYIWDNIESQNFNKSTQSWGAKSVTTFDNETTTFDNSTTNFSSSAIPPYNRLDGAGYLIFPRVTIVR